MATTVEMPKFHRSKKPNASHYWRCHLPCYVWAVMADEIMEKGKPPIAFCALKHLLFNSWLLAGFTLMPVSPTFAPILLLILFLHSLCVSSKPITLSNENRMSIPHHVYWGTFTNAFFSLLCYIKSIFVFMCTPCCCRNHANSTEQLLNATDAPTTIAKRKTEPSIPFVFPANALTSKLHKRFLLNF